MIASSSRMGYYHSRHQWCVCMSGQVSFGLRMSFVGSRINTHDRCRWSFSSIYPHNHIKDNLRLVSTQRVQFLSCPGSNRGPIVCGKLQPSSLVSMSPSMCPSSPVVSLGANEDTQGQRKYSLLTNLLFIACGLHRIGEQQPEGHQ